MNAYAASAYRTRSVSAAHPAEQVALLLQTAARHLGDALAAIDRKDIEARYNATEAARQIVVGLQSCLAENNPEAQPMVEVYDGFYDYVGMLLTQTNVSNDRDACETAMRGLSELAQAWRQIAAQPTGPAPATGAVASGGLGVSA